MSPLVGGLLHCLTHLTPDCSTVGPNREIEETGGIIEGCSSSGRIHARLRQASRYLPTHIVHDAVLYLLYFILNPLSVACSRTGKPFLHPCTLLQLDDSFLTSPLHMIALDGSFLTHSSEFLSCTSDSFDVLSQRKTFGFRKWQRPCVRGVSVMPLRKQLASVHISCMG